MKKSKLVLICLAVTCVVLAILLAIYIYFGPSILFVNNYYTSAYFSVANFKQITTGITCQEVRDLVGLPLKRTRWQTAGWCWTYSLPLRPDKPYRKFELVFDNSTNKVVRVLQRRDHVSKDPKTKQWIGLGIPKPASPWQITDFHYDMTQGESPVVKAVSEKIYLIQIMATWCKPCAKGRARIQKLLMEGLSDIPVQLLLVSVDKGEQELREYISKNQVTTPVAWDPNDQLSKHMNQKLIPKYLLLKGNTLYPFDFPHYVGESEEYYDDLAWFIRHVAKTN